MLITLALYLAITVTNIEPVPIIPVVQVYENRQISEEDFELLSALVYSEAGGECFEGQVGVAEVVLNRVGNGHPNSIKGVIYERNQFCGIDSSTFGKTSHSVNMAVRQALKEPMFQSDTIYYANPDTATDKWFIENVIYKNEVAVIGRHHFSREPRK